MKRFLSALILATQSATAFAQFPGVDSVNTQRTLQRAIEWAALHASVTKLYPKYPAIVFSDVKLVDYVASRKPGGEYERKNEWHGTIILQSRDGECLKVVRENFRLNESNGLQLPAFSGSEINVACPQMPVS